MEYCNRKPPRGEEGGVGGAPKAAQHPTPFIAILQWPLQGQARLVSRTTSRNLTVSWPANNSALELSQSQRYVRFCFACNSRVVGTSPRTTVPPTTTTHIQTKARDCRHSHERSSRKRGFVPNVATHLPLVSLTPYYTFVNSFCARKKLYVGG